jgi:hypothetical protein
MSIFDEGTSSAGAMKVLIEGLLQPIFDGAAKAGPFVKEMFKGMVYGALQVAIFVLKARNAFLAMLPESVRTAIQNFTKDNVHDAERVHDRHRHRAIALAIGVGILTVALIAMAVAELAALWPILLIVAAIALVIAAIVYWDDIVDWISGVWDDFVDGVTDAVDDIIDGIVNGIKTAPARCGGDEEHGDRRVDAFKGALGIKSPSKVFELQGSYTHAGLRRGHRGGAPT